MGKRPELATRVMQNFVALQGANSTLVLQCTEGKPPGIVYWGRAVRRISDPQLFAALRQPQQPHGSSQTFADASLSCELGTGYFGPAGLLCHSQGQHWAPLLTVDSWATSTTDHQQSAEIQCSDGTHPLAVNYRIEMNSASDLVSFSTTFTHKLNTHKLKTHNPNTHKANTGQPNPARAQPPLIIDWASVVCIAAPAELTELISLTGRWAGEFHPQRHSLTQHGFITENRRGRTSQDNSPGFVLCEPNCTEQMGACLGLHLGWSGNYRARVDCLNDGRRIAQLGENFGPGELQLLPGTSYTTPVLYASYSAAGLSGMSQNFHDYYRAHLRDERIRERPRPVHYNTWEGIYFDHDTDKLLGLAAAAADIGVERFVLDDGWFLGRRDDSRGLGDWFVDPDVYPNGLQPLIDAVQGHGMEFGLWVEPEMVNPDSELYRNHPDWVLSAPTAPQLGWRNQLVLNLTRSDVRDYLYGRMDALLSAYDIAYLKWDMNRDLTHPGGSSADGDASINLTQVHQQTLALYQLIDDLRAAHPTVEIESCSSGGARADYGILRRTDRLWTSDSNDAIDRQRIQRGASMFFPLEVLGAHVGPYDCHITGRKLSMALRAATALFGHMGVEANLLEIPQQDREELAAAIALYKTHRKLIHTGDCHRLERSSAENCIAVVAKNKRQALVSFAELDSKWQTQVAPLRFVGLDPAIDYRMSIIWPPTIASAAADVKSAADDFKVASASGELLMNVGIQPPLLRPQSSVIFQLQAVST